MIEALYAVNFLKGHLQRFKKYNRINVTINCGDNYVSFYAIDNNSNKQYLTRGSNHHLRMQHLADKNEPWNGDNISIEFIAQNSPQDTVVRARVYQKPYGGIKPFDVTIYQYDNTILDERDLSQIFRSILSFLNGNGYNDPFKGTPKAAKVMPRTANIKPYKEPTRNSRNISVNKDGNYVSANSDGADYVSENKYNKQYTNMNKKVIRLTESDIHRIVKESVNKVLNEIGDTPKGQYMLGRLMGKKGNESNLRDMQRVGEYARQQRIRKDGDRGDNDYVIDNPLRYNFVNGERNYRKCTDPNFEWFDGYEDENGDVNYVHKNGSIENEKEVAKDWLNAL